MKMNQEIGFARVNWIHLSLGTGGVAGCYEFGNESYKAVNFLASSENVVFSRRILLIELVT
jgi:hypothetical protein